MNRRLPRARRAGEEVETPSKSIAFAKDKEKRTADITLETLLDVRKAWADAPNTLAFVEWLSERIIALGGKP